MTQRGKAKSGGKTSAVLLYTLQKSLSLLGAECQDVSTTPLHANEHGQTVRFITTIEPQFTGNYL